jgi:hypothetical protein
LAPKEARETHLNNWVRDNVHIMTTIFDSNTIKV